MSDLSIKINLPDGKSYDQPTGLFINNKFVPAKSGEFIESINPHTDEVIAKVHAAGKEDIDDAVAAAKAAFKSWKKLDGTEKRDLLWKLADLVDERREILASLEAHDSGKPRDTNAIYDIDEVIDLLRYVAGWADKMTGKTIPAGPGKFAYTVHEPIGVVGCIIPFNYPLGMFAWKLTAIAAGNTAIFKSAEQTPLSILYFANLFVEAGFPPGVANVVSGTGKVAGNALVEHLDVSKIAFTGSTATGQLIQKTAAINLKALTLECGGKTPLLVFEDADFDQAVKWTAWGIFNNMGQICTGSSRVYVQEPIYEKFLEALKKHVEEEYPQGDPFDSKAVVGPQVSKAQYEKILGYLKSGKESGARVILGGDKSNIKGLEKGYYVQPTIFADVKQDYKIVKEEIFGPVVSVGKFSTTEEAIELANDSVYGLGASLFTQDITKAHTIAQELEAGMVWINSNNDSDVKIPFGGVKLSGYGRELGEYGMSTFTQAKAVHVNLANKL
ncbi:Retinal dehydrogenase [Wickerhamomyces ciferrii]|uniref:Retinal dehydrogenase n=1 Tax=Wickerhamomyces ciferrii (strain ATCC 14091 / BCRC 22168 / CBS 111 / JCM 3599 / NBRC 0793 / NRRL Y-1031 F-60-10) TaxID=1206466 RepID=K0KKE1_WICCF|nr:Retinal dehydrogenase [Wickerhamomyces ciferrii]CCH42627.1 Retinal dehydrogenase [Wickerhamomyces ciferrii]